MTHGCSSSRSTLSILQVTGTLAQRVALGTPSVMSAHSVQWPSANPSVFSLQHSGWLCSNARASAAMEVALFCMRRTALTISGLISEAVHQGLLRMPGYSTTCSGQSISNAGEKNRRRERQGDSERRRHTETQRHREQKDSESRRHKKRHTAETQRWGDIALAERVLRQSSAALHCDRRAPERLVYAHCLPPHADRAE